MSNKVLEVWLSCGALAWHVQSPRLNLQHGGKKDRGKKERINANRMAYIMVLNSGPQASAVVQWNRVCLTWVKSLPPHPHPQVTATVTKWLWEKGYPMGGVTRSL